MELKGNVLTLQLGLLAPVSFTVVAVTSMNGYCRRIGLRKRIRIKWLEGAMIQEVFVENLVCTKHNKSITAVEKTKFSQNTGIFI